jgi:hypothetical protein
VRAFLSEPEDCSDCASEKRRSTLFRLLARFSKTVENDFMQAPRS